MSVRDQVIANLQRLSMSGYEAKAYTALVMAGIPLNGYEVAKASGVPRSTVYESLRSLVSDGAAFEVQLEGGTAYLPLPPESLISRLRREFDDSLNSLSSALPALTAPSETRVVHNISGSKATLDRARDLIDSAREDLFLSLWAEDSASLTAPIQAAEARGVDVFLLSYNHDSQIVEHMYPHAFTSPPTVLERVGCRLFVVARDRRDVLIGAGIGDEVWAVYSDDPAMVLVAVEFVRHDISMQVMVEHFGMDAVKSIWRTNDALMRVATGRTGAPGLTGIRNAIGEGAQ